MFSSRILLNLGLIVLLSALIGLAVFNNSEEIQVSSFSSLKVDDVSDIIIKYKQKTIEVSKQANIWNIAQPSVEADEFRIYAILSILSAAQNNYYDIDTSDYKKFSLDKPLATLTLNEQTFRFGSISSVNKKRYVLTNNKLFLIEDTIYPLIISGFKNIMSRKLFSSDFNINSVKFNTNHVYLNDKNSWETQNKTISPDNLKKFIDNWKHIQAYTIIETEIPYTGTSVVFNTSDNKTITLIVQKTDINTRVINPELGLSYQFDISAFSSLTDINHYNQKNSH